LYQPEAVDVREPEYSELTSPLCRELSSLGNTNIKSVVQQGFQKAGLQTADLFETLSAKIDAQHHDMLASCSGHQQTLVSTLNTNQRSILASQNHNQQMLSSIQRTQAAVLIRQNISRRVAARTQKQTSSILHTVTRAETNALDASKRTTVSINNLAADVRQLLSLSSGSACAKRSGREMFFLGERQDMIMAYLLPIQDDMKNAIRNLISQHIGDISPDDAEWLLSEFEHLVGSAAQEQAAQYSGSTAKPFDQWSYPHDTVGYLKHTTTKSNTSGSHDFFNLPENNKQGGLNQWSRKRSKRSQRTWTIPTASGDIQISLPNQLAPIRNPQGIEEVGFNFTFAQNRSILEVRARFFRDLIYASQPRMCAQLNVFVQADDEVAISFVEIIQHGTIPEIDTALRKGIISPFYLSRWGDNVFLYVSSTFSLRTGR
jgi:hypothetical protein